MEFSRPSQDRTDFAAGVVMPVVIRSMIGPFKQNFTMLETWPRAHVRGFSHWTRTHHRGTLQGCRRRHGHRIPTAPMPSSTGSTPSAMRSEAPASPATINLEKTKERGIASATCCITAIAPSPSTPWRYVELTRHAGRDMQVKQGGGTVPTVSNCSTEARHHRTRRHQADRGRNIANAFRHESIRGGTPRAGTGVREPECHSGGRHERVDLRNSDVVSVHMRCLTPPVASSRRKNLDALRPGTLFVQHRPRRSHRTRRTAHKTSTRRHSGGLGRVRREPLAADDRLCARFPASYSPAHRMAHRRRVYRHDQAGGPIHRRLLQGGIQRRRLKNNREAAYARAVGEVR